MSRSLLTILIFGLVLLGIAALNGAIVALALPLLVALALGYRDQPGPLNLSAARSVSPDRAPQQSPVEMQITITNHGALLYEIMITDPIPAGLTLVSGSRMRRLTLAPGGTATICYSIQGGRGSYIFDTLQIEVADRLGLFPRRAEISSLARLLILPDIVRLRQMTVRPRRTRVYSGMIPARQGGPGVEFFGVRPYQPGDQPRQINARATARQPEGLVVNEYEQERVADIAIVLDARERSDVPGPGGSLFEHGVQAAAALSDGLLAQGNRVGLLIYGDTIAWSYPGYGKVQREKISRALAAARPGDRIALESLDAIPTRLFPLRSLIVVISPLIPEDHRALGALRARGYQLIVLSPDPVSFEARQYADQPDSQFGRRMAAIERDLMLRRMRQIGVTVVNWPVEQPLQQVATYAFARRGR
jgi:uncharacterized protein (DUF58 family)